MSLDFYIHSAEEPAATQEPCPHCHQAMIVEPDREELFWANITHNVSRMWTAAGVRDALYDSEGWRAGDIIGTLTEGVAAMERDPPRFRALSAPNGWGTYEQALPWLRKVLAACVEHPDGVIHISR